MSGSAQESLEVLFAEVCKLRHKRVHALFHTLGLHRGQPAVLRALWEQEGLTHTELCRRLGVQPATITKMICRMEKAGFVERRPDPRDGRVSRVYLTAAGRTVREEVQRIWEILEKETFAGLDDRERELLRDFLRRIKDNLQRTS